MSISETDKILIKAQNDYRRESDRAQVRAQRERDAEAARCRKVPTQRPARLPNIRRIAGEV